MTETTAIELNTLSVEEFKALLAADDRMFEYWDGEIILKTSPTKEHQEVSASIMAQSHYAAKANNCRVVHNRDLWITKTQYVIPDILLACQGDEKPLILMEILCPSTASDDLGRKLMAYSAIGIKEYWIIDYANRIVDIHHFFDGTTDRYASPATAHSKLLPWLQLSLTELFDFM